MAGRDLIAGVAARHLVKTARSVSLYHGTTQEFSKFDPKLIGKRDSGNLGRGIYLTKDATFAMRYAEDNVKRWGGEPVVLKVRANLRRIADFYKLMPRMKDELGVGFPPRSQDPKRSAVLTKWFTDQGFDAAFAGSEVVVFDPRKLIIVGREGVPTGSERLKAIFKHFQETGEKLDERQILKHMRVASRHRAKDHFGPRTPLMERDGLKVRYRVKASSNGIMVAAYEGAKRVGHIDAFPVPYPEQKRCGKDVWKLLGRYPEVEDTSSPRWTPDDGEERTNTRALAVGHAFITDESKRGLGIGGAMYLAIMVEWFHRTGPFLFMPDDCGPAGSTSAAAKRVWKSLARRFPSSGDMIAVLKRPALPAQMKMVASDRHSWMPDEGEKLEQIEEGEEWDYLHFAPSGREIAVPTGELRGHGWKAAASASLRKLKERIDLEKDLSGRGGIWFVVSGRPPSEQDAQILGVPLIRSFRGVHTLTNGGLVYADDPSTAIRLNRGRDHALEYPLVIWVTDGGIINQKMPDLFSWRSGLIKVSSWRTIAQKVAAKFKSKKEVPKADGKGTTTVYEYSERQIADRNRDKAKKVEKLRGSIGKLRTQVKKDLKSKDEKTRNVALAIGLIDLTYERVGNPESAKEGHVGVTGWTVDHLTVGPSKVTIKYVGKSGVKHEKVVDNAASVAAIKKAIEGKGKDDLLCGCTAEDVNEYLKKFDVTAKDLRGFHANTEMQTRLKAIRSKGGKLPTDKKEREKKLKDEFKKALEETAEAVGHEASTLKSQYLVPGMEEAFLKDGTVTEKLDKSASVDRIAQRVARRWATKTPHEKAEEDAEALVKPAPKAKPPRHDLRRERLPVEDTDTEKPNAENDRDLSMNYKKLADGFTWPVTNVGTPPRRPKPPTPPTIPRPPISKGMGRSPPLRQPKPHDGETVWESDDVKGSWVARSPGGTVHGGFRSKEKAEAYSEGRTASGLAQEAPGPQKPPPPPAPGGLKPPKPNGKTPKEPEHKPGKVWQSDGGWAAKNLEGDSEYGFEDKDSAEAYAKGKAKPSGEDEGEKGKEKAEKKTPAHPSVEKDIEQLRGLIEDAAKSLVQPEVDKALGYGTSPEAARNQAETIKNQFLQKAEQAIEEADLGSKFPLKPGEKEKGDEDTSEYHDAYDQLADQIESMGAGKSPKKEKPEPPEDGDAEGFEPEGPKGKEKKPEEKTEEPPEKPKAKPRHIQVKSDIVDLMDKVEDAAKEVKMEAIRQEEKKPDSNDETMIAVGDKAYKKFKEDAQKKIDEADLGSKYPVEHGEEAKGSEDTAEYDKALGALGRHFKKIFDKAYDQRQRGETDDEDAGDKPEDGDAEDIGSEEPEDKPEDGDAEDVEPGESEPGKAESGKAEYPPHVETDVKALKGTVDELGSDFYSALVDNIEQKDLTPEERKKAIERADVRRKEYTQKAKRQIEDAELDLVFPGEKGSDEDWGKYNDAKDKLEEAIKPKIPKTKKTKKKVPPEDGDAEGFEPEVAGPEKPEEGDAEDVAEPEAPEPEAPEPETGHDDGEWWKTKKGWAGKRDGETRSFKGKDAQGQAKTYAQGEGQEAPEEGGEAKPGSKSEDGGDGDIIDLTPEMEVPDEGGEENAREEPEKGKGKPEAEPPEDGDLVTEEHPEADEGETPEDDGETPETPETPEEDEQTRNTVDALRPLQDKRIRAALNKMDAGSREATLQAFDKRLEDLKGLKPEQITKKLVAKVTKAFRDPVEGEEGAELGQRLAEAIFAQDQLADPSKVGGKPISGTALSPSALRQRQKESFDKYKKLSPQLRQAAMNMIAEQMSVLPEDPKDQLAELPADSTDPGIQARRKELEKAVFQRKEYESILDGLSLAAQMNDETCATGRIEGTVRTESGEEAGSNAEIELRPPIPPMTLGMARYMDHKRGDASRLLWDVGSRSTDESITVFADALDSMTEEEVTELADMDGRDGLFSEFTQAIKNSGTSIEARHNLLDVLRAHMAGQMVWGKSLVEETLNVSPITAPSDRKRRVDKVFRSKAKNPVRRKRLVNKLVTCINQAKGMSKACLNYAKDLEYDELDQLLSNIEKNIGKIPIDSTTKAQIKLYREADEPWEQKSILSQIFVLEGDVPVPPKSKTKKNPNAPKKKPSKSKGKTAGDLVTLWGQTLLPTNNR